MRLVSDQLALARAQPVAHEFAEEFALRDSRFHPVARGVVGPLGHEAKLLPPHMRELIVDVFQREAARIRNAKWLAQGTIYPDVIESAGAKTKKAGCPRRCT